QVTDLVAWAKAVFQKIFSGASGALSAGVDTLDVEISAIDIREFSISNFVGEELLQAAANSAFKTALKDEIEKVVEEKVLEAMKSAINSAVQAAGSKIPGTSSRRRA
ncbi:unnamed protein product, partial [Effrenium voratum]